MTRYAGVLRTQRGEVYERRRLRRECDGRKGRAREWGPKLRKSTEAEQRYGSVAVAGNTAHTAANTARGGRWGVLGTEGAGCRARDGASGPLLREALLFEIYARTARECFSGGIEALGQSGARRWLTRFTASAEYEFGYSLKMEAAVDGPR